jgi:NAD(P)-dependent dehydrogenase (short-subunit alcohol dehydrogenase family)
MTNGAALVVGVGPALGAALGRRFAKAGHKVALCSRNPEKLAPFVADIEAAGGTAKAYGADATKEADVTGLLEQVEADLGALDAVIYNASGFLRAGILEATAEDFEAAWRSTALGAFLVGREAARRMVPRERGTILFTGATASMRGGSGFFHMAMGKFGQRAVAQSLARELGPKGIHVAHVVIDGQIMSERWAHLAEERGPDALLEPDAIAEAYYRLHAQHRSAWAQELDLRPWVEKF